MNEFMAKHLVRIVGLKDGTYKQVFEIKDEFFESYENSEVVSGIFYVITAVEIKGKDRKLTIKIDGTITNLLCDYCAQKIELPISITSNYLIRISENKLESIDEIIFVQANQHQININQLIFEMIILSIPSKRFHQENSEISCDEQIFSFLDKYASKPKRIDPRWNALKKIK